MKFAQFVRAYFTAYGYIGTYHLVGNIRITFTGPDTADVRSLINSTHWMADGRLLFAPISYQDKAERGADGKWKIAARELVVLRWWVTDGYFPVPTDPTLARPAA
jgi:SnoaL-like domain